MNRLSSALLGSALALGAVVSTASAQVIPKRFSVVTRIGAITPERSASLETAGLIGLDTEYAFTKYLSLGTALDVSRGNSKKEDFIQRLRFGNATVSGGDSINYQYVGQPVSVINAQIYGAARAPLGKVSPFIMGGVGTYLMLLDAQVEGASRRKSDLSLTAGAGVTLQFSERYGVQFDVRGTQYRNYDRTFLDASDARLPNKWFPEDFNTPPAAKKTALNTTFTLGFRYVPGGLAGGN